MPKLRRDADENNGLVRFFDGFLRPLTGLWLDEEWRGADYVPTNGGVVLAANHLSYIDPILLGRFVLQQKRRWPHFLAKSELFTVPILGQVLDKTGQVPVHRGTARASESFHDAVSAINNGRLICVMPEGTLTRDMDYWPMQGKSGAARIALTTGCPLIPVALWGSERIVPPGKRAIWSIPFALTHRHPVSVVVGEAVNLDDLRGRELDADVLHEATNRLMLAITTLLADVRSESPLKPPMDNPRVGPTSRAVRG